MNTLPVGSRTVQRLHALSLLAQVSSRKTSGRLQVVSESTVWALYLSQGQLVYVTNLVAPFERLDRHLSSHLGETALSPSIRQEIRSRFEQTLRHQVGIDPDYRALCWLVEQNLLRADQAAAVIEAIAKELLSDFLTIRAGTHDITDLSDLEPYPTFCELDLRRVVEHCQEQIRQRQASPSKNVVQTQSPLMAAPTASASSLVTTVPVAQSQSPGIADRFYPEGEGQEPAEQLDPSREHYTIVCIDDSPTVLQAINCFLDDQAFSVVMINDPVKALMQVVRSQPDLILLDVGMPNLDGYELCSLLRRHPNFKTTPIIMVTGHTGFIDRAKAKLVGASNYLTKPFTQAELLKTVFKHLNSPSR
ncbi:MAG: response regulator [Synechococcales bacterium]|nr:response regulator [Synechococcales bacterium]